MGRQLKRFREIFPKVKPYYVLFLMPTVFALLFGYTFSNVLVENIPIVVYDMDNSAFTQQIAEELDASPGLDIIGYVNSKEEVEDYILSEKAIAACVIPENFYYDMKSGKNPGAIFMINSTNFLIGNNCMLYATNVFTEMNTQLKIQKLQEGAVSEGASIAYGEALSFTDRMLYNPQLSYIRYFLIGILAVVVQQTYMVFSGVLFIENKIKRRSRKEILTILAQYMVLSLGGLILSLLVIKSIFGFGLSGNILITMLMQLLFLMALTGIVLTMTSFFKDAAHYVEFTLMLAIPTLLTSAYAWPVYMMPKGFMTFIKLIWPLCNFAAPIKNLQLKGLSLAQMSGNMMEMAIFAAAWIPIGLYLYNRSIKKQNMDSVNYGNEDKINQWKEENHYV